MLKIMICVNPNKDKELTNTKRLLDYFKSFNVKVIMSDIFKRPYFDNPALSDTLLSEYNVEYIPEYAAFKKADICIVFGGDGTILKIAKKASQGGAYILGMNMGRVGYLAELEIDEIERVDGMGLMLGAKLKTKKAGDVVKKAVENGVIVLTAKEKLRFLPPLTISFAEIDKGIEILKGLLTE